MAGDEEEFNVGKSLLNYILARHIRRCEDGEHAVDGVMSSIWMLAAAAVSVLCIEIIM